MSSWLSESRDGISISVLVQPRASRTKLIGEHDGRLKIALAAPPVDGEANQALIEFVSELLEVRKSAVSLAEGHTSRKKRVVVAGISLAHVQTRLTAT